MNTSETVRDLIFALIDDLIADSGAREDALAQGAALPKEISADLRAVLADNRISYRDGVMIQLAYGLAATGSDLTRRSTGARSVAQQLGTFLAERHIRHVKDAYQNIAKNTDVLTRGNVPEFDRLLQWATNADQTSRKVASRYACASVAATARPVQPMPTINRSVLTFGRMVSLLSGLLDTPSAGAFEQFTVAALLHTLVGDNAIGSHRVETKNLNASDRSSYSAGDVQIVTGKRVIEAFEVTANAWATKLADATKTIRDNDLSRLHIVAHRPEAERTAVAARLAELGEDVSVLDVRQVVELLVAVLTRPQRADALARLYEYLDRHQSDADRVNLYVERLTLAGLIEDSRNRGSDDLG